HHSSHDQAKHAPAPGKPRTRPRRSTRRPPPPDHRPPRSQNVSGKRENRPHRNVKTSWSPVTESNRRPSPYHAYRFRLMTSRWVGLPQAKRISLSEHVALSLDLALSDSF